MPPFPAGIGRGITPLEADARRADRGQVRRASNEAGFGMIELLIAMVMLNVGILALVAAFSSGTIALGRASKVANASTLAEMQMERFRGIKYTGIIQDTTEWNSAVADATWTADPVYQNNMKAPITAPKALVPTTTGGTCAGAPVPMTCDPSRTVTAADGRSYRVDTYLYYDTPANAQQLKVISVVVRDATQTNRSLARITSTFDSTTGQ
jgi:Tfp pilus assembly protein PilV